MSDFLSYLMGPPDWAYTWWERNLFRPIVGFALSITALVLSITALVLA